MATVIGSHEVKNFQEWKKGFEADEPNRVQKGIKLIGLYNSIQNPNEVTFIFDVQNAEAFSAMMINPQFQEKMKNAGVINEPQIKILNSL